ncbi:MAG: NAD(P)-binding domain-containing protein [Brevibacterium aurantiacum]|uniref:Pyrroline-5-carboxylate reductase n=3 Tax=Brevibacterium TaxID=1696 RepID=A0A4Z0KNS7_BREAU|nr:MULTISPECIES: NAD(P)-binding domain-containing protein [Brevibacterium]MDN5712891.1 NAD(P)-binding domain-containing protein [Brevibacterium aurantiacum]MDN5808424.1 NAD(P)-binding domain-containing protein [Brevibacterium sp.]MDN5877842.1 NAD(P)-binding domain-containing protein [Brevibacterium sp.]MDN5910941.1 NAD(P)-binding domain-containing protein [Brevibacterium sp.]MDN6135297.1 NAD(P)-binding domain-containing protein [Brevibacterium sp.]
MSRTIGIIGVGEIASAIVEGSCAGADHPDFLLSPRNAERSAQLASDFDRVEVCESNQDVIDRSEHIILSVLPQQTEAVLAELDIPSDRTVISAIAGVSTQTLSPLLPQNPTIVRIIPLPPVRERRGVTAVFPAHAEVEDFFNTLGGSVVAETEELFSTLSATTATMSAYYVYLQTIADWLVGQGWDRNDAERIVRGQFAGLGNTLTTTDASFSALVAGHETPGGLNEMLHREWLDEDNRDALAASLDRVFARVTGAE